MGEARKRKNPDGSYKFIKGDSYKWLQPRLLTRYIKIMREKRRRVKTDD